MNLTWQAKLALLATLFAALNICLLRGQELPHPALWVLSGCGIALCLTLLKEDQAVACCGLLLWANAVILVLVPSVIGLASLAVVMCIFLAVYGVLSRQAGQLTADGVNPARQSQFIWKRLIVMLMLLTVALLNLTR